MLQSAATAKSSSSSSDQTAAAVAPAVATAAPAAPAAPMASVSGGVPSTAANYQPTPGTSGLAPGQPLDSSTGTQGGVSVDRELRILQRVEELVRVASPENRQKAAFINFLRETIASIDDDLFPEYYDHVVRYTRKFVDESRRRARTRAQREQERADAGTLEDNEGAVGGQAPSSGLPRSEMEDDEDDSDSNGGVIDPDLDLPDGPSLLGVSRVTRGPTGRIVSMGPSARHQRLLSLRRPSSQGGDQPQGTWPGPQASSSSAGYSVPHSMGSYSGQHGNVAQSAQRFQAQFNQFASQQMGCTAMNITSAASTVTTVTCGDSTRTYASMTNVPVPSMSSGPSTGFVNVRVQGQAVQGGHGSNESFPSFDSLTHDSSFPPSIGPLNPATAHPVDTDLNTPQGQDTLSSEDA